MSGEEFTVLSFTMRQNVRVVPEFVAGAIKVGAAMLGLVSVTVGPTVYVHA